MIYQRVKNFTRVARWQNGFCCSVILLHANEISRRYCFQSCLSVHRLGPHVSITHDALDLTVQKTIPWTRFPQTLDFTVQGLPSPSPLSLPLYGTPLYRYPVLVISCGKNWRPVLSCSVKDPLVLTFGGY